MPVRSVGFAGRKYVHELPQPQKAEYSPLAIETSERQPFAADLGRPLHYDLI
jgi:hypothetical protein